MSREKMNPNVSRVSGSGSYGNFTIPRENLDDVPELTAEQVKAAYNEALRADQAQQNRAASIDNAKAFVEGHAEWINSDANIALMNHELKSRFGIRAYSISDYEECYASLRSSNFLNLNKTVLSAQEKQ